MVDVNYSGYTWVKEYFEITPEVTCPVLTTASKINDLLYSVNLLG
jgi:hypothetical protein